MYSPHQENRCLIRYFEYSLSAEELLYSTHVKMINFGIPRPLRYLPMDNATHCRLSRHTPYCLVWQSRKKTLVIDNSLFLLFMDGFHGQLWMQRKLISLTFCLFRQTKLCKARKIEENSSLDCNNKIKNHSYTTYTNELQLDSGGRL